jgi:hypothetical protein
VELDDDECVGTMLYISLEEKLSLLQGLLVNLWKVEREVVVSRSNKTCFLRIRSVGWK